MSPSSLLRIPTMDEMGFPSHTLYSNSWVGGETEALRRLPIYCQLRCHQTTNQVRAEVMIRQTDCVRLESPPFPSSPSLLSHLRWTLFLTSLLSVRMSGLDVSLSGTSSGR